jgi:hypothetical protein
MVKVQLRLKNWQRKQLKQSGYFLWGTPVKGTSNMSKSDKVEKKQEKLVEKIEDSEKELSDLEIVNLFIQTENEALNYIFQGKFFPDYHYEIKRIYCSAMKDIGEEEKIDFFFHTLRLGELYPSINTKNYSAFKSALIKTIPLITDPNYDHIRCCFDEEMAQILFNIRNVNSSDIFNNISYDDLKTLLQFYTKCKSYWDSENMLKKTKQFEKLAAKAA